MEQQAQLPPLPRALDVQRFAGAREQEIRALCAALKESELGAKFGVAALPRHLRRRAGSHKPYKGHRLRPNVKLAGKRRKLNPAEKADQEQGEGAAAQPESGKAAEPETSTAARPFTNRRMRRQPSALQQRFRQAAMWTEASLAASAAAEVSGTDVVPRPAAASGLSSGSGSVGGSSSTNQLRRLETHVWHAKRLAMEERYGWLLPAGAAGQGRGSRSFVHVTKASAVMHDASYLCPLLLSGTLRHVQSVLGMLLEPAAAADLETDLYQMLASSSSGSGSGGGGSSAGEEGIWGGYEVEVMLHQPGQYPRGAICPAQLLLCPSAANKDPNIDGSAGMDVDGAADAAQEAPGSNSLQAVLWVHPAAAAEAAAVLRAAAAAAEQRPISPGSGAPSSSAVAVSVLDLRRLEIRGGAADAALAVVLAGGNAGGAAASGDRQMQHNSQLDERQQQEQRHQRDQHQRQQQGQAKPPVLPPALSSMQHGDAIQLLLPDPRLLKPVVLGQMTASLLPAPAEGAQSTGGDWWQAQPFDLRRLEQVPLPLSEAELSSRRSQLRRRLLQLEPLQPTFIDRGGIDEAQHAQQMSQEQQLRQRRGCCPVVLVRQDPQELEGIPGWSLVLPAGWVPTFWLAAAYAACKPSGQREWRWLHTLQQRRCFPWDYPDCPAYAALMRQQHCQRQAAAAKRPPGKKMLAAPPSRPDWHRLVQSADSGGSSHVGVEQQQLGEQSEQQSEQQRPMEVDSSEPAAPPALEPAAAEGGARAAGAAEAAGTDAPEAPAGLCVARTYSAMTVALYGHSSSSPGGHASSSGSAGHLPAGIRPVAAALRQGLLQWRPKQHAVTAASCGDSKRGCCLLEAFVQPIKSGSIAEGAEVCFLAGHEAERHRRPLTLLSAKQRRRQQRQLEEHQIALLEAGGDLEEAEALAAAVKGGSTTLAGFHSGSSNQAVDEELVRVFGYVLSEAPRGAPRRCASLAAVQAQAAWRLRSLQHWAPRLDGGAIEAFVRNPGSTTVFPVRLRLLVEPGRK